VRRAVAARNHEGCDRGRHPASTLAAAGKFKGAAGRLPGARAQPARGGFSAGATTGGPVAGWRRKRTPAAS
jgi:hypothetical protein